MTPRKFWRTTPAQLNILTSVHSEITNPSSTKSKVAKTVEEAGIDI
jgi:hypothetical protein